MRTRLPSSLLVLLLALSPSALAQPPGDLDHPHARFRKPPKKPPVRADEKKPASGAPMTRPDARPVPQVSEPQGMPRPEVAPIPRLPRTPAYAPMGELPGRPDPWTRPSSQSHSSVRRWELDRSEPLQGATRPFDATRREPVTPASRSDDHRYARPHRDHVRPYRDAPHPPSQSYWYRPHYTHWYVHPYWRHEHATIAVVWFDFYVFPWSTWWIPPHRPGWVWVSGYWAHGYWYPGYWEPVVPPPYWRHVHYVYVPGWWQGTVYVDGYWRPETRGGWVWVDGYYLDDGTYVRGYWRPGSAGPEGYVWEAGFYDGEVWVEGFWRPEYLAGFVWISSYYDGDGIYHAGYWEPLYEKPGHVWIPGWFDGSEWIDGYWVTREEYREARPEAWEPPEGWDAGHDDGKTPADAPTEELPLALPVEVDSGS